MTPPMWQTPWRWPARWVHVITIVALLVWIALQCVGALPTHSIAAASFDQMQRHRLWASQPDPRILIIDIDERSLADMAPAFGLWPWSRETLATLLEHARSRGAQALVFDILFSDPDRSHPGGDLTLSAAVAGSKIAFFPVARLPATHDNSSDLTVDQVPGIAKPPTAPASAPRISLILPFMQAMVKSSHLGTNTAHLDSDGKIRRFAFNEPLTDGWALRSLPSVVALHLGREVDKFTSNQLIVWRDHSSAYPRVPFSLAWKCAEGSERTGCPDFGGRILIVGATASSLHDIKSTPLGAPHMGVDILATLVDNALHQRSFSEISAAWSWIIAAAALLVAWSIARRGKSGSTGRALWALPMLLLGVGYLSLHSERLYIDLSLPAAAALTFLSTVKLHDTVRRHLFGLRSAAEISGSYALLCGGPTAQAERIERAVVDFAAAVHLPITGSVGTTGDCGPAHSMWVIWCLADRTSVEHVETALRHDLPDAWYLAFEVGRIRIKIN